MATLFNTKIKDTYQSLLKLEDNTILTTTSKNITDGLGNASPLYLSTTQVRIGSNSASAMYWDNTNNRLGIGTSAPSAPLEIRGITNSSIVLRVGGLTPGRDFIFNPYYATNTYGGFFSNESGNITLGASLGTDNGSGIGIILGAPAGTRTALLHLKGTGSTSATTSLLVQNSSAVDLLKLQDNGDLTLGTFASGLGKLVVTCDPAYGIKNVLVNNFGGLIIRQVSTDVIWFGGQIQTALSATGFITLSAPYIMGNNPMGNTTASSFNFRVTGSPYGQTPSTASRGVLFDGGFGFQSGGYGNYFELSPTYTFDVSNGRVVKGIYYNPTLVTPNTNDRHIAIETVRGDVLFGTTSGFVGIGTSSPDKLLTVGSPNYGGWSNGEPTIKFNKDLGVLGSLSIAGDSSILYLWRSGAPANGSTISSNYDGSGGSLRLGVTSRTDVNIMQNNGDVTIGNNITTLGAKLGIKGNGSTSATTSLLVQNSSGALSFKCTDDLVQQFNGYQTSFTHPTYTGSLLIFSAGNNQQTIRGGNGENIVFGAGGNTMNLNATEVYVSSSFLGSNFWIQPNGSFCLGQQAAANASAQLEMRSTTKGFLPPRVTTIQKNAISSPAEGLFVYDTDLKRPCFFNGTSWITL